MDPKTVRVGISVILSILIVYVFLSWTQQTQFFGSEMSRYQLQFDQIGGLLEGDPVFIRGYEVGKVENIQLTSTHILVDIQVQQEAVLFQDAYGEIMMKDLMGAKAVTLHPGESRTALEAGNIIPGKGGADWGKLMSSVNTLATILEKEDVNGWLIKSEKLLDELLSGTQLLNSDTVKSLLASFSKAGTHAEVILADTREKQLVAQLESTLGQVASLSFQMDSLARTLQPFASSLTPELVQKSDTAISAMIQLVSRTENLVGQGELFLSALQEQKGILGRTVYDTTLSSRFDSTLTLFEGVLTRLKDERIRVGIALSKEKESANQKQ